MATTESEKKPTVLFSRKDTLHAPTFEHPEREANAGEHLIHSIDKQNSGAARPHPSPGGAEATTEHRSSFSCLRAIFCCCKRSREPAGDRYAVGDATLAAAAPAQAPVADKPLGSLGFPGNGKPTLVLDLDETLVHSSFKPIAEPDFVIPVTIEGHVHHVYVLERPGTAEFLQRMEKHFEIICFTASLSKYANPLLDLLDKNKTIKGRLYREHCVYHRGTYVKDLSLIGRELASTLIVDNSKNSYMFQPQCGVPCTSFIDDKSDRELYALADWLEKIADAEDMTKVTPEWSDMWEKTFNNPT